MPVFSGSATDKGLRRSTNEDNLLVRGDLGLFVVADGMGGHAAGEVASQVAVEGIAAFVEATVTISPDQTWPVPFDARASVNANRLRAGFCMANGRLAAQIASSRELRGMATTAVAMLVDGAAVTLAHVGDSRAYLLRAGRMIRLTVDHTFVQEEVEAGRLTEKQARTHRRRSQLTRALGFGNDIAVDMGHNSLAAGDRLLLCSDGLTAMVTDDRITDILAEGPPSDAVWGLIEAANRAGGHDNISVVVVQVMRHPAPDEEE